MFETLLDLARDPTAWSALVALVAMEVVLGIDNLIFVSIISNKLPPETRDRARRLGIALALVLRLALLGMVAFIVQLTQPVITVLGLDFSWRDMILLAGGLSSCGRRRKRFITMWTPIPAPTCSIPSRRR
jgi:predicted tellurium resistance membrane protein TerC